MSRITDRHIDAVLDFDRQGRIGIGEAVFCEHKTPEQIDDILGRFQERGACCLLTRFPEEQFAELPATRRAVLDYEPVSRTAFYGRTAEARAGPNVAIVSAGSSDAPTALEAARTLEFNGIGHALFQDIGVAGLWRLLDRLDTLRGFSVMIAVAGMEGALFSVLGGLVRAPIIAVPTSIGYGVSAQGRLALDSALGSCAPGVVAVNIDNGYGAACAALRLLNSIATNR